MSIEKMRDHKETKTELLKEVESLRKRVAKLRQTEEELGKSEEKYHSLVYNIPDILWTADSNGNITFISPNVKNIYGYKPEEICEQGDRLWFGRIHPDDVEKVRDAYKALFEEEKQFDTEYRFRRKDGEWIWLHDRSIVTYEKEGVLYVDCILSDITKQKKREKDLEDSEEKYRTLSGNIPALIYRAKADWSAEFFSHNETTFCGYLIEDFMSGKIKWLDIIHPDDKQRIFDEGSELAKKPGTLTQEYRILAGDSSVKWVEDHKTSTFMKESKLVGVDGVVFDITERKQAEEKLWLRNIAIESSINGIAFVDIEGNLIYVNDSFLKMWDYPNDKEVLGKPAVEFWADIDNAEEIRLTVIEKGSWSGELVAKRSDGSTFEVELSASLIKDKNDNPVCLMGSFVDVTIRRRVEGALRESEVQLRRAQEVAYIGSWYLNLRTDQLIWSDETYRIFGVPLNKPLREKDFLEIVHPDDRSYVEQSWAAALRGEQYDIEHRILIGGIVKWVREKAELEFDADGKPVSGVGTVQDITTCKKAENALRESEKKYKTLFQSAAEGIIVADIETKQFKYVNQAICTMLGYTEDELKHMGVQDVHPKEELEYVISEFEAQTRGEKITASEIPCLRKDGTIIYADISTTCINIDGAECNVGFFADVTDRKKAEDEVKKFREMADGAPFGCAMAVPNGNLTYVNNTFAEMHGYTPAELIGKNLNIFHTGQQMKHAGQLTKQLIETGEGVQGEEVWHIRRDGTVFPTQMTIWVLKEPNGNPHIMCATAIDITEHKKAEEELRKYREKMFRAERLASVGTLSAEMAHTLNSPLTAIKLSIQNAMIESKKTPRQSTIIEYLEDGLNSLSEVSSRIHGLGKFAAAASKEIISEINLKEVAERTINLLNESAQRKKISLHLEYMGDLPPIYSHEKDLEQLFFSLIENAIQAADGRKSHQLIISGAIKDKHIELRFTDDCCGIPSENLDKIFELFFTTSPPGEGTGLGLCIVERIVSKAGGNICVESKVGKGSTFFVTLPISRGSKD